MKVLEMLRKSTSEEVFYEDRFSFLGGCLFLISSTVQRFLGFVKLSFGCSFREDPEVGTG